ncbi:MAG: hypothetical protein KBH34_00530 [Acetomicrobium sp.]|jgi:hypothetical protein|nr:hypothetical protein [Acetomicrobium sp.]MBP8674774.1 hypothetical protein [Acetomicrobium sp.]
MAKVALISGVTWQDKAYLIELFNMYWRWGKHIISSYPYPHAVVAGSSSF